MALTDLLKNVGRSIALTGLLYTCGGEEKEGCQTDYDCREPRVCVRGYCESPEGSNYSGNGNNSGNCGPDYRSDDSNVVANLCRIVWQDCNGLPGANYQVGANYDDCMRRGPQFICILGKNSQDAFIDSILCVVSRDYSCSQLESDDCDMPENDLYGCVIDGERGC